MNVISHADFERLSAYQINGTSPFQGEAEDLARTSIEEAHALLLVLGNVLTEVDQEDLTIHTSHIGRAVEGVRTLVALAAWASECERKGR